MSVAVLVKVHDGVVLASDSASTLIASDDKGNKGVANVYNNADKIFNLYKGLQIGMVCVGSGSIGEASISTLAKDLRNRLSDKENTDWCLDEKTYTIEQVSKSVIKFFHEEKYQPYYKDAKVKPLLSFFIAGYSSEQESPEVWQIIIGGEEEPKLVNIREKKDIGVHWGGESEAIHRLIIGYGTTFHDALKNLGVPEEQIKPAVSQVSAQLQIPLVHPAMPIQDAIDLARFLVQTTIDFIRFNLGAPTVGGAIEIAAITKHEGFKWVQRKHYFDTTLNPGKEA